MNSSLIKYLNDCKNDIENVSISIEDSNSISNCVIIYLSGYIDSYNSNQVQSQIFRIIDEYKYAIFDFTDLRYMSSTGIGAFTEFYKRLHEKDGDMAIYNIPNNIYEVFSLLGFIGYFKHSNTKDGVVDLLKKGITSDTNYFPKVIKCPACNKRLSAKKSGKFRCPACRCIIGITNKAEVYIG